MPFRFSRNSFHGGRIIDAYSLDSLPADDDMPNEPASVRFRSVAENMLRGIHRGVAAGRELQCQTARVSKIDDLFWIIPETLLPNHFSFLPTGGTPRRKLITSAPTEIWRFEFSEIFFRVVTKTFIPGQFNDAGWRVASKESGCGGCSGPWDMTPIASLFSTRSCLRCPWRPIGGWNWRENGRVARVQGVF